jgi:hypothetical protein
VCSGCGPAAEAEAGVRGLAAHVARRRRWSGGSGGLADAAAEEENCEVLESVRP